MFRAAALVVLSVALILALAVCGGDPPAPAPENAPAKPPADQAALRVDPPGRNEVRYFELDPSCPYCRDLRRLIEGSEAHPEDPTPLAKVYEGKVTFVFRPAFDEKFDPNPEAAAFDFGGSAHGFAGIAPDGTVKFLMPGHHWTRADLTTRIDKMLK